MPLKGGFIFHLTYIMYIPYLVKLQNHENPEFSLNCVRAVCMQIDSVLNTYCELFMRL